MIFNHTFHGVSFRSNGGMLINEIHNSEYMEKAEKIRNNIQQHIVNCLGDRNAIKLEIDYEENKNKTCYFLGTEDRR